MQKERRRSFGRENDDVDTMMFGFDLVKCCSSVGGHTIAEVLMEGRGGGLRGTASELVDGSERAHARLAGRLREYVKMCSTVAVRAGTRGFRLRVHRVVYQRLRAAGVATATAW